MRTLFLFTLNAMRDKGYGTVNRFNSAHSQHWRRQTGQIKNGETKRKDGRTDGWTVEEKKYATQAETMSENSHDRALKDDKRMRIRSFERRAMEIRWWLIDTAKQRNRFYAAFNLNDV